MSKNEADEAKLDRKFNYHKPDTAAQQAHTAVRFFAREYSAFLEELLDPSPELTQALTKIEESMFWANAAVAREGK